MKDKSYRLYHIKSFLKSSHEQLKKRFIKQGLCYILWLLVMEEKYAHLYIYKYYMCVCDYFFALHICVSLIKFIKQWFPMFSQIFLSIFVSPFFTLIYITLLMNIFPPMVSSAPMVSSVMTKIMTKANLRGTVLFGWDVHVRVHVEVVAITRVETKKETVSKEASAKWWNWGLSLSVLLSVVSLEHVDRLLFAIPTG